MLSVNVFCIISHWSAYFPCQKLHHTHTMHPHSTTAVLPALMTFGYFWYCRENLTVSLWCAISQQWLNLWSKLGRLWNSHLCQSCNSVYTHKIPQFPHLFLVNDISTSLNVAISVHYDVDNELVQGNYWGRIKQ